MTREEDFFAALTAAPDDWQTLLVFADWLDDRDDPRAEGYRALAAGRFVPWHFTGSKNWGWFHRRVRFQSTLLGPHADADHHLPYDWFAAIRVGPGRVMESYRGRTDNKGVRDGLDGQPALAFDAAARAFAALPAVRRRRLLAAKPRKPRKTGDAGSPT